MLKTMLKYLKGGCNQICILESSLFQHTLDINELYKIHFIGTKIILLIAHIPQKKEFARLKKLQEKLMKLNKEMRKKTKNIFQLQKLTQML